MKLSTLNDLIFNEESKLPAGAIWTWSLQSSIGGFNMSLNLLENDGITQERIKELLHQTAGMFEGLDRVKFIVFAGDGATIASDWLEFEPEVQP